MKTLIKGGTIVFPKGKALGDVLIEDGKIVDVHEHIDCAGEEVNIYDATGKLIFPGFIDAHTRFEIPGAVSAEGFYEGTKKALTAGVTAVQNVAIQKKGESLTETFTLWNEHAKKESYVNFCFLIAITDWNEDRKHELSALSKQGVNNFLVFLSGNEHTLHDGEIYEILKAVDDVGGTLSFYCENGELIKKISKELIADGMTEPDYYSESHPDICEGEAIARVCFIAEAAKCPINILNISSARGLGEVLRARAKGVKVYADTATHYLYLDESLLSEGEYKGAEYVTAPPLRKDRDRRALWSAVSGGQIHTVSSDHRYYGNGEKIKEAKKDFSNISAGVAGVSHRPMLIFKGVAEGKLSEERMCATLSENPARIFGLYPHKGVIAGGADANIVVWDSECEEEIETPPYAGIKANGKAQAVFLNGELAFNDGNILLEGQGKYAHPQESEI